MIISGKAAVAGVIGWPVGHSRSPRLHNYWLSHYGIDGAYVPLAAAPENIDSALHALPILGFAGANITLPHKEAALAVMDRITPVARRIGAVNTVIVRDGELVGDNTDAFGFLENLRTGVPEWRPEAGVAVILGSGGAARAVAAALIDAGTAEIRIANRSPERAEKLAADFGGPIRLYPWSEREAALEDALLLVNTTTLGMTGAPPLELALDRLPSHAVVSDIVYVPLETPLLAAARARGHAAVDGLGMLLHQARPGFEAWFGLAPEVTPQLRAFMLQSF